MTGPTTGTVFHDFTMLMVLGFVAMVVWLLPHINPPAQSSDAVPPGNVVVAITWPEGDTDIDLWITGPGELVPVGYSNKGGVLFNLLRDDLGHMPDATPFNEVSVNDALGSGPRAGSKGMKRLATSAVELRANGEEKTALRFRLRADGSLEPDSLNNVFRPLRAADGGLGAQTDPDYGG